MASQSIWTITVCKIRGISYYAHMSLLLLLFWLGYEEYQRSHSVLLALTHSAVVAAILVFLESARLFIFAVPFPQLKSITMYPFGGISNSERSLHYEHYQSAAAKERLIRLSCLPAVLLAIVSALLFFFKDGTANNDLLDFAYLASGVCAILLLLPVSPFPGGRLFVAFCQERPGLPDYLPTIVKFAVLMTLLYLSASANSIALLIISLVYTGIAIEQHLFERTRNAALPYIAEQAMIPAETLISFSHGTSCEDARQIALTSFQPVFPVNRMTDTIGYVEKNSLIQARDLSGQGPTVSEVMTNTMARITPDTPLPLVLNIFRESETSTILIFDENNKFTGLLHKDKVIEFLVLKSLDGYPEDDDQELDE